MSSVQYTNTPAGFQRAPASTFIAADGAAYKVLVDALASAAASGNAPLFYGGSTVIDLSAVSADSVNKDLQLATASVASVVGAATGALTTTTNTYVRASGSWITDGWRVGDMAMAFAAANQAPNTGVDGILTQITAVTAGTLTVNGVPLAAGTIAAGGRLCRVSPLFRASIQAGSGTNGVLPSTPLLGNDYDGSLGRQEIKLGASDILVAGMAAAVSALPAYVAVNAAIARY